VAGAEDFTREDKLAMRDVLAHAEGLLMVAVQVGMVRAADDEQRALLAPIAERLGRAAPRPAPGGAGGSDISLSDDEYLALWPSLMRDLMALSDLRRRGMIHSHDAGQQAVMRDIDRLLESVSAGDDE
jgi:hypothetical protein